MFQNFVPAPILSVTDFFESEHADSQDTWKEVAAGLFSDFIFETILSIQVEPAAIFWVSDNPELIEWAPLPFSSPERLPIAGAFS